MSRTNELWQRYRENCDLHAREEIINAYAYLAKYVVDRLNLRPSAVIGYDDLIGHAVVGLIDAVEKFDQSRDVKFETYASLRIRGAVLDAIKDLDWMPRSMRSTELELKRAFSRLEAELGRAATDEEVAAEMGLDIDGFNSVLADVGQAAILSLEEITFYGEETEGLVGLGNGSELATDPASAVEFGERTRLLAEAIDNLPDKERLVVSLYYKEGLTQKEIAAVLGVTESRACQLHAKAVVRLQGKLARHAELMLSAA